jgi:hypothetical protein
MAAGITGIAAVDNSLPTEFIAEVKLADRYSPVMRNLVRNETLPEHEGSTWQLTELTRSTIVALSDGEDLTTAEQITDSALTIVPTRYGGQVVYTKEAYAKFTKRADLARLVGEVLREDMLRKEDVDLLTQLDSFSVALGSAGTALTIGHIMAAGAAIRGGGQAAGAITSGTQNAPHGPIHGVFTSAQLHPVTKNMAIGRQILTTSGASQEGPQPGEAANKALRDAFVGRLGGVDTFVDDNLGKDSSDDAKGGVFAEASIIQVHFMGGVRIVPDEDPSRETKEVNVFMNKGIGEYKDAWGREMLFDAAAPTS